MKQFVYVLVSDGPSVYADMTAVSVSLLTFLHPEASIQIVTDQPTVDSLTAINHNLVNRAFNLSIHPVTTVQAVERSRELRIRLRELVTGDFVYLDNDTLPVRNLSELFTVEHDFAAAENHSTHIGWNFIKTDREKFDLMGWKKPELHFINSGVTFWRDTPQTHRLSKIYMEKWKESRVKTGQALDQPALNSALVDWGEPFTVLDNRFNAQIIPNINTAVDGHIYHLYSSGSDYIPTWMTEGLGLLRTTGTLSDEWLLMVLNARTPFITRTKKKEHRLIKRIQHLGYQFNLVNYYLTQYQFGNIFKHYYFRFRRKFF